LNFLELRRGEVRRIEPRLLHPYGLAASTQLLARVDDANIEALSSGDRVPSVAIVDVQPVFAAAAAQDIPVSGPLVGEKDVSTPRP
jgi:hypothetical protein